MLKINKLIFVNLMFFLIINIYNPIISSAMTTATVYLESNKSIIEKGEEIEISFNIKDQATAAYNANIYFDETKFEFISGPENINVNGNRIIIVWYDPQGGNGAKQGELGKLVFKAKEDGISNFVIDGEFFSEKGQSIQTNFEAVQVQVGKEERNLEMQERQEQGTSTQTSNANLQSLRLDKEGMVPAFKSDIHEYDLTISNDINNLEVLAIAENPNSQIEIMGNTGLKEGLNLIKINVISEDKTQNKLYTIKVTKTANEEVANTNLETLAIENVLLTPPFDDTTTQYNAEVSNETTNLKILAIPENESAKAEISGNGDLKEGNNLISITVTASNGITQRVYQVSVYKRNAQEEEIFKEEQSKAQEMLEQAYEIENTASEDEDVADEQAKRKYLIICIVVAVVMGIVIGYRYYKKKKVLYSCSIKYKCLKFMQSVLQNDIIHAII